ncbi:MAG TPA: xanthine dehydrogenase molybdenum-binding subunit XdhA, partial [Bacillota bacterium]|nr:xanthine dehydrogenase molybdenum-binding subunit XdhA [Bacillota bacterium]
MEVGKSFKRVDAFDKVTGRAKYADDLCPKNAYVSRILHSTIAHGRVIRIDTAEAAQIDGVVKVLTCFDVPDRPFPTAGHPWNTDPGHQDVADRKLLNEHVRYYGDDIAVVIAEDTVAADRAIRALTVEYEAYPFVLDPIESAKEGAPLIHGERQNNNILAHSSLRIGNYAEAIKEPGLIKVEGWYHTPTVQHSHIENHICFAYQEQGQRVTVCSSTQIPHIVRRVTAQALGWPWGKVRIIKPYIGGGFGNKQDALYEPLCAWLTTQVGGHPVKLDVSREETFVNNRVRHAMHAHITSWMRPDGTFAARKLEVWSDQGAYASHGHSVAAKGMGAFPQLYPCDNVETDAWTVYTNKPTGGAMRGYGIPQAMFQNESHIEDIVTALNLDPIAFRRKNSMPVGYFDSFSKNELYEDSFNQCLDKAIEKIDYDRKRARYRHQTGPVRRGIGAALFWYNTAVWPISIETSSCRMIMNQDGSIQLITGETEIGQGCDTVFAQMAADTIGLRLEDVHVFTMQDTDVTPYGSGAYASRQTYIGGFSIRQTGQLLKEKILKHAHTLTRMPADLLDIIDGTIVRKSDNRALMTVGELATRTLYDMERSEHLAAESTYAVKSNAYSFGVTIAEVEVDIPLCQAKVLNMVNVHDCGTLINPQLAEAQVHGGMSMALGFGLYEELLADPKTGRILNDNLLDYKLPTTMDHPDLLVDFVENAEPTSPFGTKALG